MGVSAAQNRRVDHSWTLDIANVFANPTQQSDIFFSSNSGSDIRHKSGPRIASALYLPERSIGEALGLFAAQKNCRFLNCLEDILVTGATAEVATDVLADFLFARTGVFSYQSFRCKQNSGGAKPTLKAVQFPEFFLQWVELISIRRHPFYRFDLRAIALYREQQTGPYRLAFQQYGAGTADPVLTADMGTGQSQIISENIREQSSRLDR